jgi:hypothetical protein
MSSPYASEGKLDVIENHSVDAEDLRSYTLTKEASCTQLDRATSTLSRIASRLSTRDIVDPGPPPDGGFKAWLQVAMGFVACFTTWGFINCEYFSKLAPL